MVLEAKHAVDIVDKSGYADNFIFNLLRKHEDVGVILCKRSDSHQTVQRAGQLVSVYLTQFSHSDREITI